MPPETLGMVYEENPKNKYLKDLRRAGCEFTTHQLKEELEEQFKILGVPDGMLRVEAEPVKENSPDKDPQKIFIHYPPIFEPEEYLADIVKVEVSVRPLKDPSEPVYIQSILNENFPEIHKETPFKVTVVEPHRTFLEKAFLLHEAFQNPEVAIEKSKGMSRHLYDLVQMMDKEPGKKALAQQELYQTIIKHRSLYNTVPKVDYKTHTTDKVSFMPPLRVIDAYHEDYDKMKEAMIHGDVPEFIHLVGQLCELLRRFRGLVKKEDLKKEYEPIGGNYIRWWEDDKQKGNNRVFARASIKYETDINYSIKVSTLIYYGKNERYGADYTNEQIETWTGKIVMETPTSGTIIWNQNSPQNGARGYKKITVDRDLNKVILIGEKSKGYGHETFTEKEG